MSSPHMSFRLNHYQIARALRILVTLEPNQPISSLSDMAKTIIIDWISNHSINATLATSQADIDAAKLISKLSAAQIEPYTTIHNIMAQAKRQSQPIQQSQLAQQIKQKSMQQIQREIEDERLFNEIKREEMEKLQNIEKQQQMEKQQKMGYPENDFDEQIALSLQSEKRTNSALTKDLPTDSIINTVTDFSPPKDWTE